MKSRFIHAALAFFAVSCPIAIRAQIVVNPGQIGGAPQMSVASASISPRVIPVEPSPKNAIASVSDTKHDRIVNRIWIGSIAAMVAGTTMDAATSWGKYEANGLLASSDGRFGAKGLSIKAGVASVVLVPQIILHKHKEMRSKFAIANFAEAGIFAAVSAHNMGIAKPKN